MKKLALVFGLLAALTLTAKVQAHNNPKGDDEIKTTICHRTNDVKKPYVRITVSENAIDGEGKNDHTHHTGPVATSEAVAQNLKNNKTKWGDIIPNQLNWSDEGKKVYDNDCKYPPTPPTDNGGNGGDNNPPATPPTNNENPVVPVQDQSGGK